MILIIHILVYASLFAIVYTWCVYPAIIFILAKGKTISLKKSYEYLPSVSVIIAAYNEEKTISNRIENLLEQNYPRHKLEIIIASDGSKDRTVEIASGFPEVKVLDFRSNRGRASVHNDSVAIASGEIVVFTDAETTFEKNFLRNAIAYFADQEYGCGAGEYTFKPLGKIGETEGAYWRIEKTIRCWEFEAGCLPFASGGCFLIRRKFFSPISPHSDIDNILPLRTIELGKKVFYAKDAKAYDVTVANSTIHFRKRIRTAQRSLTDIFSYMPRLWRAKRYAAIWVLISHRLIRWMTGVFAFIVFIGSLILTTTLQKSSFNWQIFMAIQGFIILLAMLGWLNDKFSIKLIILPKISNVIYSFALANIAFFIAIIKALQGHRITIYNTNNK